MFSRLLLLVLSMAYVAQSRPQNSFPFYNNNNNNNNNNNANEHPFWVGFRIPVQQPTFNPFKFPHIPSIHFPQIQMPNLYFSRIHIPNFHLPQFLVPNHFPFPTFPQGPLIPQQPTIPGAVSNEKEFKYVVIVGPFTSEDVTMKVQGRYVLVDAKHEENQSYSSASGSVYVPSEYDVSKVKLDVVNGKVIITVPVYQSTEATPSSNEKESQNEVTEASEGSGSHEQTNEHAETAEPAVTAVSGELDVVKPTTPVNKTE